MNVKVVYGAAPISEIAVECPKCKRWFHGRDITVYPLEYEPDISNAYFKCPVCGENFTGFDDVEFPGCPELTFKESNVDIETVLPSECYKDCVKSRAVWEN